MAKFIPDSWKMSPAGAIRYQQEIGRIDGIVQRRAQKYNIKSMSTEDLLQEGRLAAAYAVDSYSPERGSLNGYIGVVVGNALAMVAAEALAQCRQAYTYTQDPDGSWRKVPAHASELFDDVHADPVPTPLQALKLREAETDAQLRNIEFEDELESLGFSEDARILIRLKLSPPPELWVRARNLNCGRYSISNNLLAEHLGWPRQRVQRSAQEINAVLAEVAS